MTNSTRLIVYSALFLSLAILLPLAFHQFGMGGRIFLPMHIPILMAGFVCGPMAGIIVGLIAPPLSFLVSGMPPPYAVPLMSLELSLLGLVAGLAYWRLKLNIYIALIAAMIVGRLGFALGLILLGWFIELPYGVKYYFTVAVTAGLPGLVIQLIILPPIVAAIMRRRGANSP